MSGADSIAERLEAWIRMRLSPRRFHHSLGVAKAAVELGGRHGIDPERLSLAGLLHDCAREYPPAEALALARRWGVSVRPVDEESPVLLHGRLAEIIGARDFGIVEQPVLTAVRYHTAGHPDMGRFDKILFLADHVEPGRDYPHVEGVRLLALEDIDRAMLTAVGINIAYLQGAGKKVDPDTWLLQELLLRKLGE